MDFPDDYAVTSGDRIFHHTQNAVGACFAAVHHRIQESAKALTDDDALALNPEEWAHEIAAEFSVTAPTVDAGNHSFEQEGRIEVNCTGWPGISFSMTEMGGPVIRAGHRFRVTMPGTGALTLLKSRLPRGGSGYKVDIHSTGITRVYEWPRVLPATQLQADVDKFLANFTAGADELSEQIARQNGMLADVASKALANRQTEIRESRAYLGDLRLKVTRDPAADTLIPALPMRNPGPGAVAQTRTRQPGTTEARDATAGPARLDQPTLDQFYDHVVTVLGAVMVGFERSPRRFAKAAEETLRDFMLVTLNSHYQGAATGETFNGAGKTDILVRHGLDNAFIGECKFWGGEGKLAETFEQLLGYTTWQDNRLALIFFVRNKRMQPVIDTTREWLAARTEFGGWQTNAPPGQLRCPLRWEDTARKDGRLTVFLVHLPPSDSESDDEGASSGS